MLYLISKLTFQGMIFFDMIEMKWWWCYLLYKEGFLNCKKFDNIVFDILLPKLKAITIDIFYRLPIQANFMKLIVKDFSYLNLKDNGIYLLGDFNNLLQSGNCVLNGK